MKSTRNALVTEFEFLTTQAGALIPRIKITGNVITIYGKEKIRLSAANRLQEAVNSARQVGDECPGQHLRVVLKSSYEHTAMGIHPNEVDKNLNHLHYSFCRRPNTFQFSAVISQIRAADASMRSELQLESNGMCSLVRVNNGEFLDDEDAEALLNAFSEFEMQHGPEVEEQLRAFNLRYYPSKLDITFDFMKTGVMSASIAVGLAVLQKKLLQQDISKTNVEHIIDLMLLIFIYKFSENNIPFYAEVLMKSLDKILTAADLDCSATRAVRYAISFGLYFALNDSPGKIYKGVKFLVSTGCSLAGSYAYHYFFTPKKQTFAGLNPGFLKKR